MAPRGPHNAAITWTPHVHVSWGGTLGTGTGEIWTNGIRFAIAGAVAPTSAELDAMLLKASDAIAPWISDVAAGTTGGSNISAQAHMAWVKVNYILETGLQRESQTHQLDTPDIHGVTGPVPFYQTWALTFRTALKRGRSHSGRIFPPCVSTPVDAATGRCSVEQAGSMAGAGADLINRLNTNLSTVVVGTCVVLSPGNATKGTIPLRQNIISVECDTVPDVQHRRTNRLARAVGQVGAVA